MKKILLYSLLCLVSLTVGAQTANVISIPDIKAPLGAVQLPVNVSNTDEIAGIQFDLTLPEGVTAGTSVPLTNRANGHQAIARNMGNNVYRVMLFAQPTTPLLGQSGTVMNIPLNIPDTYNAGEQLPPLVISNAVLSKANGENVLTAVETGTITISELPDLTVKGINIDKTTLIPSENIVVSWQVQNIGGLATNDGWSEQITLICGDGSFTKLIATTYCEETLSSGAAVSRQADIVLPKLIGINGEAYIQVRLIPNSQAGESAASQANNTLTSDIKLNVEKRLFVDIDPANIVENAVNRIKVKVSRSGDWSNEQTFALSATNDSRISLPSSVTIPASQSAAIVYMSITDNEALDDNNIVTVTAQGDNYPDATGELVIEDNEYPDLTLTASKSVVTEGETFQLTVKTSRVSAQPITVTINSENTKRFSFPQTVTISAGATSATVEVTAVDDELPSLELSNAFTASAPNHNKAEVIVVLKDDDLPVLELQLTPTTVQESAGVVAVAGVLRRTTNTNSKITVKLTDDANGGLYFGNRTLVLDKGVEEVHFNFGPVDNALVDGDRTYTITAAVWLSSCSCGASGESAGYVEAQLQVLDNDGPALSLTSSLSTVKEGGSTTLTVIRNTTNTTTPLTVALSSDYEEGITYQHTVTIPAGQQSATVEVSSASNSIQGDSHTVIFTVQADGYATGTCYLMITDQTLPDARISSISADVTEAEVETKAKLTIEVVNDGAAELPAEVAVKIYHRGEKAAIGTLYTSEPIVIGGSLSLSKTITLPTTVGSHSYYAVVNESNKVQELTYNNNTSQDVVIKATAPFSVTVSTDKSVYQQGEKIIINGQLTGNGTGNTTVDLYLINEGARQVQQVTTDAQGAFTYEWQLYALQSGHFVVGACYPGEELKTDMATFDVYGLNRTDSRRITCDITCGDTYRGSFGIVNPGKFDLTGANVVVLSKPETCNAQLSVETTLPAGQETLLLYSIDALSPTDGNRWEEIKARISTTEGAKLDVTLYVFCRNAKAKLVAATSNIVTTMSKDNGREYNLRVTNIGRGNTGRISLSLPEFINSLAGSSLPGINQNDTLDIPLNFMPTDQMQLNVPVTGRIGINCENGEGVPVNFNITPVSDDKGTLVIDVCDEYTYYTTEAPHVAGAEVVVRNSVTGALVTQGITNSDGLFSVVLPEGYYKVSVTADKHGSYTNIILVDPGTESRYTVNIGITAISVDWNVVETEIEDQYTIVTTTTYETNVPTPVVLINAPEKLPLDSMAVGESIIFNVILTNKGLVNAYDTELQLPEAGAEWYMTQLDYNEPFILAPQTSIAIPVKFTKTAKANIKKRQNAAEFLNACMTNMREHHKVLCGTDWLDNGGAVSIALKICTLGAIYNAISGWSIWSAIGGPGGETPYGGGPGGGTYDHGVFYNTVEGNYGICDPRTAALGNALLDASIGVGLGGSGRPLASIGAAIYGGVSTGANMAAPGSVPSKVGGAIGAGAGAFGPVGSYAGAIIGVASSQLSRKFRNAPRRSLDIERSGISWIDSYYDRVTPFCEELLLIDEMNMELFGDSIWLCQETEEMYALGKFLQNLDAENDIINIESAMRYKPSGVSEEQFRTFMERINNTSLKNGYDNSININKYASGCQKILEYEEDAMFEGYTSQYDLFSEAAEQLKKDLEEAASSSSVCAKIKLQITQTMVMTRQAFRGTLSVTNGNENTPMTDIKLKLNVTSLDGLVATAREFQFNAESIDGFSGELDFNSGWTLNANSTGTATILFIPTKYAAPEEPVEWFFGGALSYIDPFTGLEVTRELYPVPLIVKPSPELDLTYFMQRDVYGDDPLTLDVVEPIRPAEFALLINNKGYGDATNVKMVTQQPEIIENEKGLYIDFELISSQVNGGDAALSFGRSIANNFGTIPAHSQMYAQWWLTSTLLGHFTDYKVEASHVTSYGNEDLSLLDQVTIHELIHGFDMPADSLVGGPEVGRAFLVNDVVDANDLPDKLYFTNGDIADVAMATTATIQRTSPTTCLLTITPSTMGWNYGSLFDPTHGYAELKSIVRQSDGQELGSTRFWQTDRTLRDGKDWLYENRLHFVDEFSAASPETYVLTFTPVPDVMLEVASIKTVPEEGDIAEEPIDELTVTFNKKIDATTFTGDDITFAVQGVKQDANEIVISTEDNKSFKLDMSTMNETLPNGYYTLTVQTADITDAEGFKGKTGKQTNWILFRGGLIVLNTAVWPERSGNINFSFEQPAGARRTESNNDVVDGMARYGSAIVFTATPDEGHQFLNWTLNGEIVSTNPTYTVTALSDMNMVANFSSLPIRIEVEESEGGHIEGLGTGIYEHHADLSMTAVPDEDYVLKGWLVNGEMLSESSETLNIRADKAMTIKALFDREYYRQTLTLARGWNWMSSYISETVLDEMSAYINRIVGQFDELINDPQYGLIGGLTELTPGVAYKVEALQWFSQDFRGHLITSPITLKKGWNWVAYPWMNIRLVSQAITNAEEGDYLVSQQGFAEYANGAWEGSIQTLVPGMGYMYKSVSDKTLEYNFTGTAAGSRATVAGSQGASNTTSSTTQLINSLCHSYPNAMSVTARICQDGIELTGSDFVVYALRGNELCGAGERIGSNYYVTVFGNEPIEISFIVEDTTTGEQYSAHNHLTFRNDVVGSRKAPYIINIGNATGIDALVDDGRPMTVYSLEGVLISHDSTLKALRQLPKGVYIINGQKCFIK